MCVGRRRPKFRRSVAASDCSWVRQGQTPCDTWKLKATPFSIRSTSCRQARFLTGSQVRTGAVAGVPHKSLQGQEQQFHLCLPSVSSRDLQVEVALLEPLAEQTQGRLGETLTRYRGMLLRSGQPGSRANCEHRTRPLASVRLRPVVCRACSPVGRHRFPRQIEGTTMLSGSSWGQLLEYFPWSATARTRSAYHASLTRAVLGVLCWTDFPGSGNMEPVQRGDHFLAQGMNTCNQLTWWAAIEAGSPVNHTTAVFCQWSV